MNGGVAGLLRLVCLNFCPGNKKYEALAVGVGVCFEKFPKASAVCVGETAMPIALIFKSDLPIRLQRMVGLEGSASF